MPTKDPLRPKALSCLREGRVRVLGVRLDARWRPVRILARVRSSRDGHPYRVELRLNDWSCTCRDGQHGEPCAHVRAVQLVTAEDAAA